MTVGVHDFAVPHEHVKPTRDMIVIRLPLPPTKVGNIEIPQVARDMAQHNVMAGRIVSMGPLAFSYKDADGLKRQDAAVGDWVVIRPFAGTLMSGGKLMATSGWRYVSSFNDVIAVIPADKMPDPATLIWDDETATPSFDYRGPQHAGAEPIPDNTRERVVVSSGKQRS